MNLWFKVDLKKCFQARWRVENVFSFLLLASVVLEMSPLQARQGNPLSEDSNIAVQKVSDERPSELEGVQIEEKLGQVLSRDISFLNEKGEAVTLGHFFDIGNPIIISPVYFNCPGLCNFHLNGLMDALKALDWNAGEKYVLLAISFDSKETPTLAQAKKDSYMKVYERRGTEDGFHFLTANEENVQKFISSVGFKMKWLEDRQEWSHGSAAIVVNPEGKITRYLPGILFEARDVRLALNESMAGKVGNFVDALVLYCFHYNPSKGKYSPYVFNIMKLGALLTVLILMIWLIPFWLRTRRESFPAVRSVS